MISEQRVEAALEFIRDHAKEAGELYGHTKGLDHQRKVVRSIAFLETKTGSVQERLSKAESSAEYKQIVEDIEDAWAAWKTLETRLEAARLTVHVWQSQNKWSKAGNVL